MEVAAETGGDALKDFRAASAWDGFSPSQRVVRASESMDTRAQAAMSVRIPVLSQLHHRDEKEGTADTGKADTTGQTTPNETVDQHTTDQGEGE